MCEHSRDTGFTLIEVLVALVIVLVSVLGVVGLSVKTVQQEAESYQRVQALTLLQEMVDRINSNRQVAACYSNNATGRTLGTGASSTPTCGLGTATQNAQAVADLVAWSNQLQGAAEQNSSSSNVGAMIGARGCITQISATDRTYRITVAWQGLGPTVEPANSCGEDQYGDDDSLRRTVNAVVRIGNLTS